MPSIRLSIKDLSYEFELTQKYNVLIGDSGSGKTTLYDMINLYQQNKNVVSCTGYSKIITDNHLSEQDLYELVDYVIVLDEDSSFLHDANIASIMQKSRNYFLVICRDVTLGFKSISLDCIFKIKSSGKYHTFEKAYRVPDKMHSVNEIVCEDSKSGMQFLKNVFQDKPIKVDYAKNTSEDRTGGKTKIATALRDLEIGESVCVVFDKSAIGFEYDKITNAVELRKLKACFIDWDSFECYILESDVFEQKIPEPEDLYESKEVLATKLISELIPYNKGRLSKCLIASECKTCKNFDCHFKHYSQDAFIYWKVKDLLKSYNDHKFSAITSF